LKNRESVILLGYKRVWRKMRRRSRALMRGRWRIKWEKELAICMDGEVKGEGPFNWIGSERKRSEESVSEEDMIRKIGLGRSFWRQWEEKGQRVNRCLIRLADSVRTNERDTAQHKTEHNNLQFIEWERESHTHRTWCVKCDSLCGQLHQCSCLTDSSLISTLFFFNTFK